MFYLILTFIRLVLFFIVVIILFIGGAIAGGIIYMLIMCMWNLLLIMDHPETPWDQHKVGPKVVLTFSI